MKQHHSDLHTLAAAYALDALDPAEREAFTDHLPQCLVCREEVAGFEATAARLADAAAHTPPDAMKHRVMAAVDGVRQLPPRVTHTAPTAPFGRRLRRRAVPLALAASVVAAASFAGLAAWQNQQNDQYQQRARQAEQRLDDVSTVLAAPDARTVHGRTANGAATTVVASERQNRAVFTASGLPAAAPGTTYQLWLDHDGTMRPAGLIRQDGSVLIDGDPADAGAVGLTLEPAGGSLHPTSAPLLLMALPT
ncbi:anti-sigma factor [Streptomyces sp. NRRL F-2664]|uniref:anti-sigma factor n=1 Tax=Streptomyces sp. NRRL F-2664 TaxID=1463842 RepID=UPI0004CA4A27|nr:anti-sigma factor [Streptomyces sp. NRRL F-2664]